MMRDFFDTWFRDLHELIMRMVESYEDLYTQRIEESVEA
jgi:hypothetical protein